MSSIDLERRQQAVAAAQRLDALGLNRGSTGNLSVRASEGGFWITPTGTPPEDITPESFVWLDDAPEPGELAMLRARGWLDRWLFVDTREEPDDLLRARQVLAKRLGAKAASNGAL